MSDFPPIKNDLQPRARLKRHHDESATDEEIEVSSRLIGEKWGAATHVLAPEPLPVPTARVTSIRGYIPYYLDNELTVKAAERRVTKTFLIMEALAKTGYRVDEVDMVRIDVAIRDRGN